MEESKCCCTSCACSQPKIESPGRRKFLGLLVALINLAVVGAVLGPVLGFIGAPLRRKRGDQWVKVLDAADLPEGETREVTYSVRVKDGYQMVDRRYTLFLRRKGDEVLALDPSCTHLGCKVSYQHNKDRYFCPCHGGVFDSEGINISGPPPKPLERKVVKVEDGKVWVQRAV